MKATLFIATVFAGCTSIEAASPKVERVISGTITLRPELSRGISPSDQVVIIAKRSPGAPPVAMKKVAVGEFPLAFELTEQDMKMDGDFVGEVELMVRIDKDGDSNTRKSGDMFGRLSAVRVGNKNAHLTVSEVLP